MSTINNTTLARSSGTGFQPVGSVPMGIMPMLTSRHIAASSAKHSKPHGLEARATQSSDHLA